MPTIQKAIEKKRHRLANEMEAKASEHNIQKYTVESVIADAFAYNNACSLVEALAELNESLTLAQEPGLDAVNRALLKVNLAQKIASGRLVDSGVIKADGTVSTSALAAISDLPRAGIHSASPGNIVPEVVTESIYLLDKTKARLKELDSWVDEAIKEDEKPTTKEIDSYKAAVVTNFESCQSSVNLVVVQLANARSAIASTATSDADSQLKMITLGVAQERADRLIRSIYSARDEVRLSIGGNLQAIEERNAALLKEKTNVNKQKTLKNALKQLKADIATTKAPKPCA